MAAIVAVSVRGSSKKVVGCGGSGDAQRRTASSQGLMLADVVMESEVALSLWLELRLSTGARQACSLAWPGLAGTWQLG